MYQTVSDKVMTQRAEAIAAGLRSMAGTKPVSAIHLATFIGVEGNRENRRRRVREAVGYAREKLGHRICANDRGYWPARSHGEWEAYQRALASGARFTFVRMSRTARAVTDRISNQGLLFETRAVGW